MNELFNRSSITLAMLMTFAVSLRVLFKYFLDRLGRWHSADTEGLFEIAKR